MARIVRAAAGLIGAGQGEHAWPLLLSGNDPRIRARFISKARELGVRSASHSLAIVYDRCELASASRVAFDAEQIRD